MINRNVLFYSFVLVLLIACNGIAQQEDQT
jgi:hypothetical protein